MSLSGPKILYKAKAAERRNLSTLKIIHEKGITHKAAWTKGAFVQPVRSIFDSSRPGGLSNSLPDQFNIPTGLHSWVIQRLTLWTILS